MSVQATRLPNNPIITPETPGYDRHTLGENINGPSLIRVPDWLANPLGTYYLYFAHHQGKNIRLAYADDLAGPWTIHTPGTLQLQQTPFAHHIASPDLHIDHHNQRLVMYYHGCPNPNPAYPWPQVTCIATSTDGLTWASDDTPLCQSYLRAFEWNGQHYGIAMPGEFYRITDGWAGLEARPALIAAALLEADESTLSPDRKPRHFAVRVASDTLELYFSRAGDTPEHIMRSTIALTDDWTHWQASPPVSVMKPQFPWEGSECERIASKNGAIHAPAYQLRDPAIFEEDGRVYLLYCTAGESGIAIAELAG